MRFQFSGRRFEWIYMMPRYLAKFGFVAAVSASFVGCQLNGKKSFSSKCPPDQTASAVSQLMPSNAIETCNMPYYEESYSPLDWNENSVAPEQMIPLSLQECLTQALANSTVMRDLGVSVVRSPESISTNLDPALVFSDPRQGEEAALSAFDANLFASSVYEDNDRRFNNEFFGVGGRFRQDLSTSQVGINKRSATGGLYGMRKVTVYDRNNQTANSFPAHSWEEYIEASARQPLLQGAGTQFNRIAGPGATPGQLNGVLLARVRTDISLIEFEQSVREFVAEVENAYWDLYYAYRDLDARIQVREIASQTLSQQQIDNVSEGKRAQAQEQVDRFQAEVIDSLNGRLIDGTRTYNGSTGGTFRGTGGVRVSERKLRFLIGMPINDGRILQPIDNPINAKVFFDWGSSLTEALTRREELRSQRWVVKQRELELIANRNFLRPQLDAITQYRMRGFGGGLGDAYSSLAQGEFQEWNLGLEYQMPIGFRRGNAAVRHSQLALTRASEVLKEQERAVHLGLSNAINETDRAYQNLQLQERRLVSIVSQLNTMDARADAGDRAELDVRLETHRRLLDARLRYHQSEVEHVLALRNVNVEKGTLLEYCNVRLSEMGATSQANSAAVERLSRQDYSKTPDSRDILIGTRAR
jgi:outer membrane protein TolC